MGRTEARESAFQLIYERIATGEINALTLDLLKAKNSGESAYLESVYFGTDEHFDFLKKIAARYAKGFAADRIYKVDLSVLLLSQYEILFMDDVPDRVSVNEALELVKRFSTEKSAPFVNGVLASVIKEKERILYEFSHPEEEAEENQDSENYKSDGENSESGKSSLLEETINGSESGNESETD